MYDLPSESLEITKEDYAVIYADSSIPYEESVYCDNSSDDLPDEPLFGTREDQERDHQEWLEQRNLQWQGEFDA